MIPAKRHTKQEYIVFLRKICSYIGFLLLLNFGCFAQRCICDEEAENFLIEVVDTLREGMDLPVRPDVYIIDSEIINAFATQNGNIVIHVGLLINVNLHELIAVIAHEMAHISGSHIQSFLSNQSDFTQSGLLIAALGAIASVICMNPAPLAFGVVGGSQASQSLALARLRQNEAIADTISANCAKTLKLPIFDGFVSLHKTLASKGDCSSAFLSTHPSSTSRVQKFEKFFEEQKKQKYPQKSLDLLARLEKKFIKIKWKMKAITYLLETTTGITDEYARAIISYRKNDFCQSLRLIDALLIQEPYNSHYAEIKMLNLIKQKKLDLAISFARPFLLKSSPKIPMRDLAIIFAHAVIIQKKKGEPLKLALKCLERLKVLYKDNIGVVRLLGESYELSQEPEKASLYSAEACLLCHDYKIALYHATKAEKSTNKAVQLKAADISRIAKKELEHSPQRAMRLPLDGGDF
jgi:predicted Zn-dependent protease